MMKSFMTPGTLSQGMEFDEVPDEDGTMPFPKESVMAIYDLCPSPGKRRVPNPNLGTPARYGWDAGTRKCKGTIFLVH
jgi:hypothetical protein